jgi:flagellar hook-associated protein 3 FlgL
MEVSIMRITEKIISRGLTRNINSAMRRIDKRYNELASGKRIQYPSDDPVGLITSMRLKNAITEADRYKENSETSISWLDASDAALNEETKVLHRLEELGVSAANGPLTDSSLKAIADEVHELKNHLLQIANTQHEHRYLFAGQQTNAAAYDDSFGYLGDTNRLKVEVGPGSVLEVSYNGQEVFENFFAELDAFEHNIRSGDTNKISNTDLTNISNQLDNTLNVRAAIGAKINRLEKNMERFDTLNNQYTKLLSETEDTDYAEATMQLKMQESVYQAALATSARIMQTTLADYLK